MRSRVIAPESKVPHHPRAISVIRVQQQRRRVIAPGLFSNLASSI